ncbi:MAG: UDP-N-acetylmuramoyl-L-alanyl-D-glutamate--2,6-diaminopimelate ligase [Bacteroidales bacterium]|nr:UDP-N-acetylmuramoyl-L-alanyl-D-glutamate--2,6-diaminopimelate ligase [Bacteroidales bacterium]
MKTLQDILPTTLKAEIIGPAQQTITTLCFDSRQAAAGACFFAIRGTQVDGHRYIDQAVAQGASAVVCEQLPEQRPSNVAFVQVNDTAQALGLMAAAFYNQPSKRLKLVGVTGTNGKTTTATLLYRIMQMLGHKAGLISTVVNIVDRTELPAHHTTPDPIELNSLLSQMCDAGCSYCFMEVSSHAVVQQRIAGVEFAGAVFTNITHDHLDYHGTFAEYIKAKRGLFDSLSASAFAITNADDRNGMVMVQNSKARISTYGLRSMADVRVKIEENHFDGMLLKLDNVELWTRLVGRFNAYNVAAIYSTLRCLGFEQQEIMPPLSAVTAVAGRFEYIKSPSGAVAVVDYAHTPDALQNVMTTISDIMAGHGRLITVVGCGGNRDRTKRPEMARIAAQLSSQSILTSDNPRFEDPQAIIDEMRQGLDADALRRTLCITDRREAIRTAIALAQPNDVVLVAGKGHEDYQEIQGQRHHFDDREVVRQAMGIDTQN